MEGRVEARTGQGAVRLGRGTGSGQVDQACTVAAKRHLPRLEALGLLKKIGCIMNRKLESRCGSVNENCDLVRFSSANHRAPYVIVKGYLAQCLKVYKLPQETFVELCKSDAVQGAKAGQDRGEGGWRRSN